MAKGLILGRPHITEKVVGMSVHDKYVFVVDRKSTSMEVRKLIEKMYGVNIVKMNMINLPAKKKRLGSRYTKVNGPRKAIVTVKKGQKIDIIPQ